MYHPKMAEFDDRMKSLFDRADAVLEARYAGRWRLRPNRRPLGATANPEDDGLFNVGAFFDPGFGSGLGRGYLVEIVVATDEEVAPEAREEIESFVEGLLSVLLPEYFPERELRVERDGTMLKIVGDLRLGSL